MYCKGVFTNAENRCKKSRSNCVAQIACAFFRMLCMCQFQFWGTLKWTIINSATPTSLLLFQNVTCTSQVDWDLLTYPIVTLGLWFVDLPVVGPTGQPPPCQADERQRSRVNSFIYLLKRIIKMSIGSEKQITLHGGPKAIMQSIQVYAMSVFRRNYVTLWLMQFLVFCGVILKLKTACPGWPGEKWWHVI
jgi:hypothetical protein